MPRRLPLRFVRLIAIIGLISVLFTTAGAASQFKILHTFQAGQKARQDGGRPWATLLLDENTGTLYGTTEVGGNQLCTNYFDTGCGLIFSLTPSGGQWTYTILYRFQGGSDGGNPRTPLVPRPDGYFYGTTTTGGAQDIGTAFRIQPGTWKEEVLFEFNSYQNGEYPQGAIAFDRKGNLYGLTVNGGQYGGGVAYRLIPNPTPPWTEELLYPNVGTPYAGVIVDHLGNVFGASDDNGTYLEGSVFELTHGKLGWQFTNIYSFQDPCGMFCGGTEPGDLTADAGGNLFGFAADAGSGCGDYGCGLVYEMTRAGGKWQETTLYQFQNIADGWGPGYGAPAFDHDGNLYGVTGGGKYGFGTVFKLSRANGWQKTTLYDFPGGAGGVEPIGGLVVDRNGNIFGTTYFGGAGVGKCRRQGCGIVFEITP